MKFVFFNLFFILSIKAEVNPVDVAFAECENSFFSSEQWNNGSFNRRAFESFRNMSPECQQMFSENENAVGFLQQRLDDYYDNAIDRGLTVDEEEYYRNHEILGTEPSPERVAKIQSNRETAKARCGGEKAVDQREKLPPVRNQGSIGWCYAFSTADLVSYETGENISANHIAQMNNMAIRQEAVVHGLKNSVTSLMSGTTEENHLGVNNLSEGLAMASDTPTNRESGLEHLSYRRVRDRGGFCRESDLPSGTAEGEGLGDAIEVFHELDAELVEARGSEEEKILIAQRFCQENQALIQNYFPNGFDTNVVDALANAEGGDSFNYLSQQQCNDKIPLNEEIRVGSGTIDEIDHALDQGGIISVAYYTDMLGVPSEVSDTGEPIESHSSTIVGRKWDESSGRCQYLLRNSWGEDCAQYSNQAQIDCESGSLWVYEDELSAHTYESSALSKYVK